MEKNPVSLKAAAQNKPAEISIGNALGETAFMGDSQLNEPKGGTEPKKLAHTEEFAMESKDEKTIVPETGKGTDVPQTTAGGQPLSSTAAFNDQPPPPPKPKAAPPKPAPPAEKILGDYKLVKKLGQGGMGSVYKAVQISLDREVALKILSRELAAKPAFVQRFQREAKVMAKLDHPNLLRCYGTSETGGYHWLAMEYVEGGSIEGWLKKLGRFSVADATHVILCCAHGLQHAHELNLVHRDIKPDNILLTKKGAVKIADLGLAKATDDDMSLTQTGTGAGTPLYMAPEQARDVKNVDARCDVFALGCMYYCLLAGEPPFKGETLLEVIEAKEKSKYVPLRKINDEVPERLELIIDKMLAKRPEHRYQDCASLARDLEVMGIANDRLSFIEGAVAAPKVASSGASTVKTSVAKTPAPVSRSIAPAPAKSDKQETGTFWYVALVAEGKTIKRKMTTAQLEGLIRTKMVHAETEVSRSLDDGYRSLATYGEFLHLFKTSAVTEKTEKKNEKFRKMVAEIDREVASRKRWKWFNDFVNSSSKMIGGALWIFIVFGVLAGAMFLFIKFFVSPGTPEDTSKKGKKRAAIELRAPNFASAMRLDRKLA